MRKTKCQTIINLIEEIAPKRFAESWDNVGLLIGDGAQVVKKVMVCLDAPDWVVDEAIEEKVDLIISHHPMIFGGIKKVTTDSVLGRKIIKLIKNDISLYAAHTNYDMANGGLNDIFAKMMGFENCSIIEPSQNSADGMVGLGRLGELQNPTNLMIYADNVKKALQIENVRVAGDPSKLIRKVAFVNGAGNKFVSTARFAGADLLVTGDVQYHEMLDAAEMGLCVIDAGHYATEKIMMEAIYTYLCGKFEELKFDVDIIKSKVNNDPVIIV